MGFFDRLFNNSSNYSQYEQNKLMKEKEDKEEVWNNIDKSIYDVLMKQMEEKNYLSNIKKYKDGKIGLAISMTKFPYANIFDSKVEMSGIGIILKKNDDDLIEYRLAKFKRQFHTTEQGYYMTWDLKLKYVEYIESSGTKLSNYKLEKLIDAYNTSAKFIDNMNTNKHDW